MIRIFKDEEWGTIAELQESLLHESKKLLPMDAKECERRWLVKDGQGLLERLSWEHNHPSQVHWKCIEQKSYNIAWLTTNPEVRIHRSYNKYDAPIGHFICLKGNFESSTGITRSKAEFHCSPIIYDRVLRMICNDPFIQPYGGFVAVPVKLFCIDYLNETGVAHTYEIRSADNGGRVWIDVEFPFETDAENFEMRKEYLPFIDREITSDPSETMKAYWYRTRMHPYMEV